VAGLLFAMVGPAAKKPRFGEGRAWNGLRKFSFSTLPLLGSRRTDFCHFQDENKRAEFYPGADRVRGRH
jgi:hypothetical protein